ncbi:extracellular solute-binding protein [Nocardioides sp. LHG3406-4]|uniref:extracellular solute-binding protein n=1 Tax=Nocardioides sp. LHG3406-4 TaxID=2804575 RepID=UPI003CE9E52C
MAAALVALGITAGTAACAAEAGGHGKLTYWAVNMGPTLEENQRLLDDQLAAFTKQTGVEVELEVLTWDVLYTRIMTAISSGRGPDVVNIGNTWSATLQDTGALLAFDDDAMTAIGGRRKFLAPCLTATGAPGEPPASIPLLGQAYGLYYNTALFSEAGITEPPATWAEFVTDAKTLTKPGQWGVSLLGASSAGNAQLAFLLGRQQGAQLFDAEGVPQFDSSEAQAAVRLLLDLMEEHGVVNPSDAERTAVNDALAELANGRAGMVLSQSSGRTYLDSVGFEDYAVAPLPVLSPLPPGGAPVQSFVAGTNVAVFADTQHRDESLELVRFLTDDDAQIALNHTFSTLPVVHGAYDDGAFADPETQMFGDILSERSETMPMVPGEGQMELLLGGAVSELWAKAATGVVADADISAALADAERQMPVAH